MIYNGDNINIQADFHLTITRQSGNDLWAHLVFPEGLLWPDAAKPWFPHATAELVGHLEGRNMVASLTFPDGHTCSTFNGLANGGFATNGRYECADPAWSATGSWWWRPATSGAELQCLSAQGRFFEESSPDGYKLARVEVLVQSVCEFGGTLDSLKLNYSSGQYQVPSSAWLEQWGTSHIDADSRRYLTVRIPTDRTDRVLVTGGTVAVSQDSGGHWDNLGVYMYDCNPSHRIDGYTDPLICPGTR